MVVISGAISPLIWVVSIVTLLIPTLITTHEPPSSWTTRPISGHGLTLCEFLVPGVRDVHENLGS